MESTKRRTRRSTRKQSVDHRAIADALYGPPAITRYERLSRLSPVELSPGEVCYVTAYELCCDWGPHVLEIEAAIRDWRAGK